MDLLSLNKAIECRIVQRLNRFVVAVDVMGQSARAWINNTGRLHELLVPGRKAFCLPRGGSTRTSYRLFAVEEKDQGALIDTQFQMRAFEQCLEQRLLPWLRNACAWKRNVRLNRSVIDYRLQCGADEVYLEVKSAVLREGHYAMYPDCPSTRGRRHIQELTEHVQRGGKACIVFVAALPDVECFRPNHMADAKLALLLADAHRAGVEVRSVGMFYVPQRGTVVLSHADLPVDLLWKSGSPGGCS
ncbi:MAG: DNA/RNA nuclease SfsA [Anaerolineae bacterium]